MRYAKFLALVPALLLCGTPALSQAAVDVSLSVNFAPPAIPVYEQPPLPEAGYIWTPGYWDWDGMDYYWVPGTWVLPPGDGLLWTPGYWAWDDGQYVWNAGYWAPEVGFYGGIDYGFGYGGRGYQGGYWHGGAFYYNRAVANFGNVNIVNVYTTPARHWGSSHVSFNGGEGGVRARPSQAEQVAMHARHADPTPMQRQHQQQARAMPTLHASQNGGRPQVLTTQRPSDFGHPGPGLHDRNNANAPNRGEAMRPGQSQQPDRAMAQRGNEAPAMHNGAGRAEGVAPETHGGPPAQFGGTQHSRSPDQAPREQARSREPRLQQGEQQQAQQHEAQAQQQQQRQQEQSQQRQQAQQQQAQQHQQEQAQRQQAQQQQAQQHQQEQAQQHQQQSREQQQPREQQHEQTRQQPPHEQPHAAPPHDEGGHDQGRRDQGQHDH